MRRLLLLARRARPLRFGLVLALTIVLVACTTPPPRVADPEAAWQQRRDKLSAVSSWTATGRIAINTEEEAWNATLHWVQRQNAYRIRLIAPLGQGGVQITGDESAVVLRTSDNELYKAADPESLLYDSTGWSLPLSGLRYWLTGLDDPNGPPPVWTLDVAGRLERLDQAGWVIDFQRYQEEGFPALPTKLRLRNERVAMRIVVNRWELSRP